jgi:hypothetical protein
MGSVAKPALLSERQTYSENRLNELCQSVKDLKDIEGPTDLSIYITGSYGRLEASQYSDLDLFFIQKGGGTDEITNIQKTLIDADLIRLTRSMRFPEFSGDGRYLEVHQIRRILEELGSPKDDYENYFTARMLLLLESRPVFNDKVYAGSIEAIVDSYYRDYHDHEKDFEHKRNRLAGRRKPNVHLKNLKLKYSRLLTCFSGIVALCGKGGKLSPEEVCEVVERSTTDRLLLIAEDDERQVALVQELLEDYAWFLERTGRPEPEVLEWISDRQKRNEAFEKGRAFGQKMHKLVLDVSGKNGLTRYLLV